MFAHSATKIGREADVNVIGFRRLQHINVIHSQPNWGGNPFFRSYGARLPSSLTRFHSRALVYSTHPPVSVYGTGGHGNITKLFLVTDLKNPHRPKSPRQLAPLPLSAGSSSLRIRHSV